MNKWNQLKRFIKNQLHELMSTSYPYIATINSLGQKPLKFKVHSETEHHRINEYGGERKQLEALISYLKPTDVIFDIGASVGLWSIVIATVSQKVVAFEPDPAIRERLNKNIHLNKLSNVSVSAYAVSARNEKTVLNSDGADDISPSLGLGNVKNKVLAQIDVETRTIDTLITDEGYDMPTILKIDIEGAEYHALLGAKRCLSGELGASPRIVFVEIHPKFIPYFDTKLEDIIQYLADLGYKSVQQFEGDQLHYAFEKQI